MKRIEERYISLLTDFGFKRIFGTKPNKDLLINFLNSLFDGFHIIKDVKYLNSEHVGDVFAERKAIFDVYCENERGEKFIVEMQNAYQKYFKDRSLFYSTFPIREQAPKGAEWNFKLEHVYTVALLNFDLEEEAFDKNDILNQGSDIMNRRDVKYIREMFFNENGRLQLQGKAVDIIGRERLIKIREKLELLEFYENQIKTIKDKETIKKLKCE